MSSAQETTETTPAAQSGAKPLKPNSRCTDEDPDVAQITQTMGVLSLPRTESDENEQKEHASSKKGGLFCEHCTCVHVSCALS